MSKVSRSSKITVIALQRRIRRLEAEMFQLRRIQRLDNRLDNELNRILETLKSA